MKAFIQILLLCHILSFGFVNGAFSYEKLGGKESDWDPKC